MFFLFSALIHSQKVLIFDAGSSSTRVYLYKYENASDPLTYEAMVDENGNPFSFKGDEASTKLSDVAKNESVMDEIYRQLLTEHANKWIDEKEQSSVPLIVYATAGMRLLPLEDQKRVMKIAYKKAKQNFKYKVQEKHFRVIPGYEEGLFAWVAVNRLRRAFTPETKTLPIFEFGGASAQIAAEITEKPKSYLKKFLYQVRIGKDNYNVFAHSWLGYGGDISSVTVHKEVMKTTHESPCVIKGANLTLKIDGKNETFTGKADFQKCYQLYETLVFKKDEEKNCGGYPVLFKDENENVCVPLPAKFDRIYAQGVMQYSADYLKLNDTLKLNDFIQKSYVYGNYTYQQAYDYNPKYMYIHMAYLQQHLLINFLDRGFQHDKLIDELVISAPIKINNVEPQWTLGAVLEAFSAASVGMAWYIILIIVIAVVAIVVICVFVVYKLACKKQASFQNVKSIDNGQLLM
ncbi:hypothetical protein TVAG_444510 [Trichomonas vaginalis G3]|uniref:Uncharacterized protein n=1 Tax=Trichomonas vaginalis (strain ATCC PRA-98 / G3) TaxID=412133 RepID=A2E2J2_TRIV3|nr:8-oxo-dGTP phosphohydrolase protein [Trichomonas vaginalis G3]EAY13167.1 hypothetical protein TVAG_444510 [Trichomonas vaginalis G3]KAI5528280.1 8-oxo-dGTP phosphohydrolase protein [Trichomonas vaginalis G3]|eukprot:XP_001325390.1 hypothetical protein [Trichomonas vaginalis G3]